MVWLMFRYRQCALGPRPLPSSAGGLCFGPMQKDEATVLSGCQDRRGNGRWWRAAGVIAVAGSLVLSGCSSKSENSAGPTESTDAVTAAKVDDIAATLPEDIKKSGKLVVGVNIPYPPNEFKDANGKIVGFDVDLMNAVASTLGLTADYRESDFAKIIPSIQQGTYNVGMSSFTDTKERQASVDFVDYFSAGILWAQRPGAPIDPNNACGKKVAVQATTTEETDELPERARRVSTPVSRRSRSSSSTARTPPRTPWCSARPTRCRRTRRLRPGRSSRATASWKPPARSSTPRHTDGR